MILYLQESIFLVHDNRDIWCILVTLNIFLYYHRANKKHGMITRCQSRWQTFMCKALVITFSLPSLHYHYPYVVGSSRFIMIIRALFKIIPIICFLRNEVESHSWDNSMYLRGTLANEKCVEVLTCVPCPPFLKPYYCYASMGCITNNCHVAELRMLQ